MPRGPQDSRVKTSSRLSRVLLGKSSQRDAAHPRQRPRGPQSFR